MKPETITNPRRPGYCEETALTYEAPRMTRKFIEFMKKEEGGIYYLLDIGSEGYKSLEMGKNWAVDQSECDDYNFYPIKAPCKQYPTITCFETIEHVQNSLYFMQQINNLLHPEGSIYLSTPARPKFLWTIHHFFEMDAKHLQKWILTPLGLQIVRKKAIMIDHPWWFYFTGIRPFIRLFYGHTIIYEIKREI